jgi:putative aldouronate transport system substrate-binding protein
MSLNAISRRALLRAGLFAGAAALLEACRPAAPTPLPPAPIATAAPATPTISVTTATTTSTPAPKSRLLPGQLPVARNVALPSRLPIEVSTPDLPGSADGLIDPGYINYPSRPFKAVAETPGSGGEVTVATYTQLPPPTPMDSNPAWQAANNQLGVTLKINISPLADYLTTRLATIIAGDDLPDILYIAPTAIVNGLPQFLQAKCADLTPYLSGDAVKDYPNLANLPTLAWNSVVFDGRICGIPAAYPLFVSVHWVHQELLDRDGLQQPRSMDEYTHLLKHFTNPQRDMYGLVSGGNSNGFGFTSGFFPEMYGLPYNWSLDGTGKLTNVIEMPAYKEAINSARELWAAGVCSPKSLEYNPVSARDDFAARKFAFCSNPFLHSAVTFFSTASNLEPPGKYRVVSPFGASAGVKPTYWAQPGLFGYSVLKKASSERINELLRILNWIAAPFGSQEYLLMQYGVKDVDYTLDELGNPVPIQHGKAHTTIPWQYITQAPVALYLPGNSEFPTVMQSAEKALLPVSQVDPTSTLYSNTFAAKGTVLAQLVADRVAEVVLGRAPVSSIDQLISDWRNQGGNQIRSEFERAIATVAS